MTIADAMIRRPKTLPASATAGEVRAALGDDHVHMVLLADGRRLRGIIVREDLPQHLTGGEPALPFAALEGRTISSDADLEAARRTLVERGDRRLAVVDDTGALAGLLCLKRHGNGFCSEADIADRRRGCGPLPAAAPQQSATARHSPDSAAAAPAGAAPAGAAPAGRP